MFARGVWRRRASETSDHQGDGEESGLSCSVNAISGGNSFSFTLISGSHDIGWCQGKVLRSEQSSLFKGLPLIALRKHEKQMQNTGSNCNAPLACEWVVRVCCVWTSVENC